MGSPEDNPGSRRPPGRAEIAILAAVSLLHLFLGCQGIGERYLAGHQGLTGAHRSTIARNYLRHGLIATRGKPLKDTDPNADPRAGAVHWHHPPLAAMLIAASFAIFGESEASARGVFLLASFASGLLLYLLVRRRHGPGAALASFAVFAVLPMQVEYGRMPNYESLVVAFSLAALLFLERLREGARRWPSYAGLIGFLVLACLVDWPGFVLAAAIGFDAILRPPRKPFAFLAIGAVTAAALGLLWLWLGEDAGPDGLLGLAKWRSGSGSTAPTFGALLDKTWSRLRTHFGLFALGTGAAWIVYEAIRNRRLEPAVGAFAAGTAVYFAAFRQAATIHVYFLYYLTPAAAVAAGIGAAEASRLVRALAARLASRLGSVLSPAALGIAAAIVWAAIFARGQVDALDSARYTSYKLWKKVGETRHGLPRDGQLDRVLLADLLRRSSRPDETVLLHHRFRPTPQFLYYLDRRARRVRSLSGPGIGRLLLASERAATRSAIRDLASRHAVTRVLGHLVFDLASDGPRVTQLGFRVYPSTPWWSYWRSSFYPPHRLVENPSAARAWARRVGLSTGAARPRLKPQRD